MSADKPATVAHFLNDRSPEKVLTRPIGNHTVHFGWFDSREEGKDLPGNTRRDRTTRLSPEFVLSEIIRVHHPYRAQTLGSDFA